MNKLKSMLKRSVGVILFAFIPGMAAGSPTVGWFWGGVTGVLTVFSSIIIFLGVQLAWDADISSDDIEKGFRAAVAKAASENKDIAEATTTADFSAEVPAAPAVVAPVVEAPVVPQVPVEEQAPAPVVEAPAPVVEAAPVAPTPNADPYAPIA